MSHSLLEIAKQRIAAKGWTNVETVEADATTFQPPAGPVDVVTFSYSLTMIPDWFAALENAVAIFKPGGTIGVVDFYVSRKYASDGASRLVDPLVLAHVVRARQRLPLARPRALPASPLRRSCTSRSTGPKCLTYRSAACRIICSRDGSGIKSSVSTSLSSASAAPEAARHQINNLCKPASARS